MEELWTGRHAFAAPKSEKQHLAQEKSVVFQIAASGTKRSCSKHVRVVISTRLQAAGYVQEDALVIETKIGQIIREIGKVVAQSNFHVIAEIT